MLIPRFWSIAFVVMPLLLSACSDSSTSTPPASDETNTLSGLVSSSEDNNVLPNITLTLADKTTVTDSNGEYQFKNIESGSVTLRIADSSYDPFSLELSFDKQENKNQDISLTPISVSLPITPQLSLSPSNHHVELSWNAIPAAESYSIYWSLTDFDHLSDANKVEVTASPYIHNGRLSGTQYYYAITAVNSAGESTASTPQPITTLADTQLNMVQGLAAVSNDDNIDISWQAVEHAQSYELLWSNTQNDLNTGNAAIIPVSGVNYQHKNLSPGTYYYAVIARAESVSDDSELSIIVNASITESEPEQLAAPQNIGVDVNHQQVTLSWDPVVDAQSYTLYWATQSGVTVNSARIDNATSPTIESYSQVGTYYYRVQAHNATTASPLSLEVQAMVDSIPQELGQVQNVSIQNEENKAKLNWDPVLGADGYYIFLADAPFNQLNEATKLEVTNNDYLHSPTSSGIFYYRIAAFADAAQGEWSDLKSINVGVQHNSDTWDGKQYGVNVSLTGDTRKYLFTTEETLRDDYPYDNQREIIEDTSKLYSRTGNQLFDGLLALAMKEVQEDSVSTISDGNFIGSPSCDCFETGLKWTYVWTRDTAYSVDLALGQIDPQRSVNSLEFKLSTGRNDNNLEIVQDTGTGGSWPISSDRVTWAMGGIQALNHLSGAEYTNFKDKMYAALKNTIMRDRTAVYDPRDGLYYGEQSFLDWREQTYPSWTAGNGTVHIGMSKTLSTNVAHYQILKIAAQLANEEGETQSFSQWAESLKTAINTQLWQADKGLYSAIKTTELDSSATGKYDALGESLAVIAGIADQAQAQAIMQNYPHTEAGVPVIWPQQPDIVVYHNRGIWPFVSAYMLKAAKKANNDKVVNHNIDSIIRGAGLNLSNMENFEFRTQQSSFEEGGQIYPVVNSQRQLWSVAGYLSMVKDIVFGLETSTQGISSTPYITAYLRNSLFDSQTDITLFNIDYKGKLIDITIKLPPLDKQTSGVYDIASTTLNGDIITNGSAISLPQLTATGNNQLVIALGELQSSTATIKIVPESADYQAFWAPREPKLEGPSIDAGKIKLNFSNNNENGTTFSIYRNGEKVAEDLAGNTTTWIDPNSADFANNTYCYAVEQTFISSGNASHHSEPQCYWLENTTSDNSLITINAGNNSATQLTSLDGLSPSNDHGKQQFGYWGGTKEKLQAKFEAEVSGNYYLQVIYGNSLNQINTGITATVKTITITADDGSEAEQSKVVFMPQQDDWSIWADSSLAPFTLSEGKHYTIVISDFFNMSYLKHFEIYAKTGGQNGQVNRANIAGLKILRITSE